MRKATSFFVFTLFVCAVVLFSSTASRAQSVQNSRVTGLVTDSTGASVAGAEVTMTGTGTGLVRTATTDAAGSYSIPELPPGSYQLTVKKEGFNGYTQNGIVLEVGSNPTLNVALQVGSVTQEVTVTANAAIVETHSSTLGQVVNQQEVLDIPLNARDPMQLLVMTPAATTQAATFSVNGNFEFPNPYVTAFAGTNPGQGIYFLDGSSANTSLTNGVAPMPFPDALQEFNVTTTAVPAQYGMHSSASVNAITKSGTNEFHGDAFEFVRNGDFNARSYYSPIRDPLKRNQFGGTIGGPIRKDKAFFFFGYQYTKVSELNNNVSVVPTPAELNGDFSVAESATCNSPKPLNNVAPGINNPQTGMPVSPVVTWTNNMTSPSNYSVPSVNLAKLFPVDYAAGLAAGDKANLFPGVTSYDPNCGVIGYQIKTNDKNPEYVTKVDYHFNDKQSVFARYMFDKFVLPQDPTTLLSNNQAGQAAQYQGTAAGWTWLLSPVVVNSLHAGVNRVYNYKAFPPGGVTPSSLGVGGNFYNPRPEFGEYTIGSGGSDVAIKTGAVPVIFNETDTNIMEDVEWTRGAHQFAFGAEGTWEDENNLSPIVTNGTFIFSGSITGNPMADFLLGYVSQFQQTNFINIHHRKRYVGLYAQDSWQVNRKLTLNYGLRWEPFTPEYDRAGEFSYFNYANYLAGVHSKVFPAAPAGLEYGSQPGYPGTGLGAGNPGDIPGYGAPYVANWKHYEPRIGVSYDPTGKGREVVRASYGIFYDFESMQFYQSAGQQSPWANLINLTTVNFTNPWAGFTNTYTGIQGFNPFPLPEGPFDTHFPNGGSFQDVNELHMKAPNLQQWNLSYERQIGQSWSVTATYLGNHSTHLWLLGEQNTANFIPGTASAVGTPNTGCKFNSTGTAPFDGTNDPDGLTAAGPCTTTGNLQNRRWLSLQNPTQGAFYSQINSIEDTGTGTYHGLIISVKKRLSNNFSFVSNYTYSHCIDNGETSYINAGDAVRLNDGGIDYGNCSFDHRHNLTITGVIRSPQFHNGLVQAIAGDWQIAPIVNYVSGDWLTVTTGTDTSFTGITAVRASLVAGQPLYTAHTPIGAPGGKLLLGVNWFNPNAFAKPAAAPGLCTVCTSTTTTANFQGTPDGIWEGGAGIIPQVIGPYGTAGRNNINGPSIHGFDLALTREIKIKEKQTVQLRFEAFNVLNLVRYFDPALTLSTTSTFGRSVAPTTTSAAPGYSTPQDPRIMQFAIKYQF